MVSEGSGQEFSIYFLDYVGLCKKSLFPASRHWAFKGSQVAELDNTQTLNMLNILFTLFINYIHLENTRIQK